MKTLAELPEKDEAQEQALAWLRGFLVQTNDDVRQLDEMCVKAQAHEKKGEELFRDSIKEADNLHKGLLAKLKSYVWCAKTFRVEAKNKISAFQDAAERERVKKERELQAQADKLAQDQQLEEAAQAEQLGDKATAQAIIERPVERPPVVLPKSTPKLATTIRKVPDVDKIEEAVKRGVRSIPGVHIYQAWQFKVLEPKNVPDAYRRPA